MVALIYLGHGLLAVAGLLVRGADNRSQTVATLASVGGVLGIALFFLRHGEAEWRTTLVEPGPAVAAGLAAAGAWLLLAVLRTERARWEEPVLIGVACCGLTLFATNRWVVTALLFWLVSSAAIAATVKDDPQRAQVWGLLGISDALLVGALLIHAVGEETWLLPSRATGMVWWLALGAALVRSGIIPRIGGWAGSSPALIPLLIGSSLAVVTGIADREQPWVGLALIVIALALGLRSLLGQRLEVSTIAAWPVALMLAILLVVPGAPWQAAATALLAVVGVLLWRDSLGRGQIERGILLALLPPTAGFSAVLVAAAATFDEAIATSSVLAAAPWTAITALLPVSLGVGVLLGARVARQREPEEYEPAAVIATWGVVVLAIAAGIWPRFVSSVDPSSGGKVFLLHVVALLLAIAVARWSLQREHQPAVIQESSPLSAEPLALAGNLARVTLWGSAALAAVAVLTTAWLTLRGLQVGFL